MDRIGRLVLNTRPASILMILEIWKKLIAIGTVEEEGFVRTKRKIISTNLAALTIALLTITFVLYYYHLGLDSLSLLLAVATFMLFHTIILNYFGMTLGAKLWFIGVANFFSFLFASVCGRDSGIHYIFLPICTVPFLVFELKHKAEMVICVVISISLFYTAQYQVFDSVLFPIDSETQSKLYFPTVLASVFILIGIMFYLSYENESAENALIQLKEKFEEEITEARKVIYQSSYNNKNSIAEVLMQQINELHESKDFLKKTHIRLQKTNIDLDNFIYTVSHDLKYPISNIEGLLNAIMTHPSYKEEDFQYVINMISQSVARFKNTIGELTEITKVQSNSEEASEIRIEELFKEVLFSLKDQINQTGAKISCHFTLCPIICFSKRNLRSILYNLMSNSLKYRSPERRPEIVVKTSIENELVKLTISDNGLGIHESHRDKIFSMFKRVHDHVEGSGVGLYIVKRIIDNCGGKIELESEVSKGSVFRIFIKSALVTGMVSKSK